MRYIFFEDEPGFIRTSQQLANAFDREEWMRIAHYWLRRSGVRGGASSDFGSFGDNANRINRNLAQFQRTVGADQPLQDTRTWQRKASRYGIRLNTPGVPTWNDIYFELSRGKTFDLPPNMDQGETGGQFDLDDTQEEGPTEIGSWVNVDVTEWTDAQELRDNYIKPWLTHLQNTARDSEWWDWLNGQSGSATRTNRHLDRMYQQFSFPDGNIYKKLEEDGTISKLDVDRALFNWLKFADMSYKDWKENSS